MSTQDLVAELVTISTLAKIGGQRPEGGIFYRQFGMGAEAVTFDTSENNQRLEKYVDRIWKSSTDIHQTVSRRNIETALIHLIRTARLRGQTISQMLLDASLANLTGMPCQAYTLVRAVHGVSVSSLQPVVIGPFTLYNWPRDRAVLQARGPKLDEEEEKSSWDDPDWRVVAAIDVRARDDERALELADEKFRLFENIARFMAGDLDRRSDVAIFNYYAWTRLKAISLTPTEIVLREHVDGAFRKIPLDDPHFMNSAAGHEWIWTAAKNPDQTEISKRIFRAIDWAGRAIRDPDQADSFIQLIMGLEALLTFKERGQIVTPSIVSQLAEFAAFIVADDCPGRLEIEKLTKDLYELRSGISHGGSAGVTDQSRYDALFLIKAIIRRLTMHAELKGLVTMSQLHSWVQVRKYT